MGGVAKHDVKVHRRPGVVQTSFVILVCVALLAAAAYAGYLLLAGGSVGFDIHWLEEEIGNYLN